MKFFITTRSEFEKLMNLSNYTATIQAYRCKVDNENAFPASLLNIKEDLIGFSASDSVVGEIKPLGKFSLAPDMKNCYFSFYNAGKANRDEVIESRVICVAGRFTGDEEYINDIVYTSRIQNIADAYKREEASSGVRLLPTVTTVAKYADYSKFKTEGIVTIVKLELDMENGYTFIKETSGKVRSRSEVFEDEDDGFYPIETSPLEILSRLSDALDLVFLSQYPENHIKALEGKTVILSKMKAQQKLKHLKIAPQITPQQYNYLHNLASRYKIPNISPNHFKNITKFEAGVHISSLERYGKLAIVS